MIPKLLAHAAAPCKQMHSHDLIIPAPPWMHGMRA